MDCFIAVRCISFAPCVCVCVKMLTRDDVRVAIVNWLFEKGRKHKIWPLDFRGKRTIVWYCVYIYSPYVVVIFTATNCFLSKIKLKRYAEKIWKLYLMYKCTWNMMATAVCIYINNFQLHTLSYYHRIMYYYCNFFFFFITKTNTFVRYLGNFHCMFTNRMYYIYLCVWNAFKGKNKIKIVYASTGLSINHSFYFFPIDNWIRFIYDLFQNCF